MRNKKGWLVKRLISYLTGDVIISFPRSFMKRVTLSPSQQFSPCFLRDFFFVVSHQTQLGLNKIIWGNPSTFGSHRSILCHQLGWEWPASSLFPQWKSTALNSMVTPRLYANRIKCSLLQVSIMIKYSLFFFSNWDSLQNIMGGIHCDSLSQLWYLLFSFNPFTPICCTSHGDTNLCSCFLEKQRGSRVKIC